MTIAISVNASLGIGFRIGLVIKAMLLEAIQKVAKYVTEYEPVFLYLLAKKNTLGREKTIRTMKAKIEKSKQRIKELDILIDRIYEDTEE